MKKHTLTLDIDLEDESPLLDDIAILFFNTDTPNYLFADDLNHLYQLALTRFADLSLNGATWPFFSYHDDLRYLNFYLVESSLTNTKIFILRGKDAPSRADDILHDFTEPPAEVDPINSEKVRRNEILLSYQQALTTVTRYNPQSPAPLSRKGAKERQNLTGLLTDLLNLIDLNHL